MKLSKVIRDPALPAPTQFQFKRAVVPAYGSWSDSSDDGVHGSKSSV